MGLLQLVSCRLNRCSCCVGACAEVSVGQCIGLKIFVRCAMFVWFAYIYFGGIGGILWCH